MFPPKLNEELGDMREILGEKKTFAIELDVEEPLHLLGHARLFVGGLELGDVRERCALVSIQGLLEHKGETLSSLNQHELSDLSDEEILSRVFDEDDDSDLSRFAFSCEGFDDFLIAMVPAPGQVRFVWRLVARPSGTWAYFPGTTYSSVVSLETYNSVVKDFGARLSSIRKGGLP